MRADDFINNPNRGLRTFVVKLRLKQPGGYTQIMDTTVQARTPEMARRIIRQQYNNQNVMVGQPRAVKTR
jgi:hypothetical protein